MEFIRNNGLVSFKFVYKNIQIKYSFSSFEYYGLRTTYQFDASRDEYVFYCKYRDIHMNEAEKKFVSNTYYSIYNFINFMKSVILYHARINNYLNDDGSRSYVIKSFKRKDNDNFIIRNIVLSDELMENGKIL